MPRKYNNMQERIIANSVHATDSAYEGSWCWVWIAKSKANRAGTLYPVLSVREGGKVKAKLAHRVSVEAFTGVPLTPGHVAKHLCNNSLCVNPAHLEGGTQRENMRQAVAEGRDWYSKETRFTEWCCEKGEKLGVQVCPDCETWAHSGNFFDEVAPFVPLFGERRAECVVMKREEGWRLKMILKFKFGDPPIHQEGCPCIDEEYVQEYVHHYPQDKDEDVQS